MTKGPSEYYFEFIEDEKKSPIRGTDLHITWLDVLGGCIWRGIEYYENLHGKDTREAWGISLE